MSWLDSIIDFGKSVLTSNSIGSQLLKTVVTGYALNKVNKSINPGNPAATPEVAPVIDKGVRLQASADSSAKIPVVYGTAVLGGKLVDIHQSADNQVMQYAYAISERTGTLLSDNSQSVITFKDIYWNKQRCVFADDGITVSYTVDKNGKIDRSLAGLVKIYCYNAGSLSPVVPEDYTNNSLTPAYSVFSSWGSNHLMSDLVFAIVQVTYSKEKNVTGIGEVEYKISNTLTMPGDCIYDLMTNTRYGASIAAEDINAL